MKAHRRLLHQLNQKTRLIQRNVNEVLAQHQLYHSQWLILFYLSQFGSTTQRGIADYLHVEPPTITRTIARLQEMGWVSRVPGNDRREWVVSLTPEAQLKLPAVEADVMAFEQTFLRHLSKEDALQLEKLLQQIGT
ncbi:MarR family winged helix-turn-helix transcriptional regulator [Aureibacillus halotolerans]|uniref:DNA-binding MarR family transcriptional regulator n=1 Tax=Aureibacillus halotolerans TaxID=1508390 RepID=A0A4R6TVG2_9BACI|nr:MarR family transcriptional regulator [Aureibacillus halotolerans]TDQ37186.1 DNA-binding MarR family transcriptional regulator [Aureibacillus halotolerans]